MASSATQTHEYLKNGSYVTTVDIVADSGDASVDDITLDTSTNNYLEDQGYYLHQVDTYPDSVTPMTDQYNLYVKNSLGKDLMGGFCENRSATNIEEAYPQAPQAVDDTLTISIVDNVVNSGATKIKLYFARY